MKIALAHFRTGQTDGVSLEMDKWRLVLEKMGHQVVYISGTPEAEIQIEEMFYKNEKNLKFVDNAYRCLKDYNSEAELKAEIEAEAAQIAQKLENEIKSAGIELLVPNNIFSLGWNLPAAIAFKRVIEKLNLKTVAHHHDFFWERDLYSNPVCSFVEEILAEYFPPVMEEIEHVVINRIAQKELKKRKGLDSTVVPNVFNFKQPLWQQDQYNQDLRARMGIKENDIVILHATRIAERKAIELAIEFTARLQQQDLQGKLYDGREFGSENRLIFLLPGLTEGNEKYIQFLKQQAAESEVEIIWATDHFAHQRSARGGRKIYSLWDSYVISDLITYTSIKEGWGNQLLEALFAKKPVVVFEYPVFKSDIKQYNLNLASLGSEYQKREDGYIKIEEDKFEPALKEAVRYLKDQDYRQQAVEENFEIAAENFSYQRLKELLEKLI
ncbi:glycosyltransferase involved in cell wall biosynthesis [Halanaerobium saccharolyticum]|uniref:Glycosyltransferase involved in cell wall biosynthesis n=1 Tax=Halanaerobium saccharolyticum TaxID=43595 RepID=A0A4R7Z3I1_9FIRM|nr:glycosyltransferase family 4 protein [Halanaerobium saccharolyticum]RAK12686.1 glycosyltransferase involved in cell wall biosynthesis [Halanaerobium saccharolyticum]TDW05402.1 glycosyltransferase involved in cell wall biosynthesis [Halanaerobium saccharolyticum]TDX62917.1 glycosyltransferase involved in cell wall biosynthesis [Halanaerobium saccharolyticum]